MIPPSATGRQPEPRQRSNRQRRFPLRNGTATVATVAVCVSAALVAAVPAALTAQQIRGRVVDERTRQAVPGAVVSVTAADSSLVVRAEAGSDGFFTLDVEEPGSYTFGVESIGYAPLRRLIEVGSEDMLVPAFVLTSQAIQLDSVGVEVEGGVAIERGVVGFARASHVVAGQRLAMLERQGIRFASAIRDLGAGLRVREWVSPAGAPRICIESNRRIMSMGGRGGGGDCAWVAIVIDGIPIGDEENMARSLNLQDFESVEFFTPVEAGNRFGLRASSTGALVLWTRGRGPHVSPERNRR
jgi:hypothetical protein